MGNTLPLMLIIFGSILILTRGPLVFAPQQVRDIYLGMMSTNRNIRLLGVFILVLGVYFAMGARDEPTLAADLMYYLGLLMIVISIFGMLIFPSFVSKFAVPIWQGFSENTLRVIGGLAVIFGLWVIGIGAGLI